METLKFVIKKLHMFILLLSTIFVSMGIISMLNSMTGLSISGTTFVVGLILLIISLTYAAVKAIIGSLIEDWMYGNY